MTEYIPLKKRTEPEYFPLLKAELRDSLLDRLATLTESDIPLSDENIRDINKILSVYGMDL